MLRRATLSRNDQELFASLKSSRLLSPQSYLISDILERKNFRIRNSESPLQTDNPYLLA